MSLLELLIYSLIYGYIYQIKYVFIEMINVFYTGASMVISDIHVLSLYKHKIYKKQPMKHCVSAFHMIAFKISNSNCGFIVN